MTAESTRPIGSSGLCLALSAAYENAPSNNVKIVGEATKSDARNQTFHCNSARTHKSTQTRQADTPEPHCSVAPAISLCFLKQHGRANTISALLNPLP